MMKAILSWYVAPSVLCVGLLGSLPLAAGAQNPPGRLPDSVRWRELECGTYGPVLQRRESTRDVQVALGYMMSCPEGPEVLAGLLKDAPGRDTVYLSNILSVSSIRHRRIADVLLLMLADRSRTYEVRIRVLGSFLQQLTGTLYRDIRVATVGRHYEIDSLGTRRLVDSTRKALFSSVSHETPPVTIDPALRAQILATIARMAVDPTETEDMRIAARDVHEVLVPAAQDSMRGQIMRAVAEQLRVDSSPVFVGFDEHCSSIGIKSRDCAAPASDTARAKARRDDARSLAIALGAAFLPDSGSRAAQPMRGAGPPASAGTGRCTGIKPSYISIATTGIVETEPQREWRVPVAILRQYPTGCSGSILEGDYVVRRDGDSLKVVQFLGRRSGMIE